MRRAALVAMLAGVWLAFPAGAEAARVAVGLSRGADARAVSAAIEQRTGNRPESLRPIPALLVDVPSGVSLEGIRGIRYVEPLITRRLAFTPRDPLISKQWYPDTAALLVMADPPVLRADPGRCHRLRRRGTHPDLAGDLNAESFVEAMRARRAGARSLVAGLVRGRGQRNRHRWARALCAAPGREGGHEVARNPGRSGGQGDPLGGDNGARVINMSLGGIRDPLDPERDTYSRLEADAVAYAVTTGVVVVAAVRSPTRPRSPWKYARYPSALPHVPGVSALTDRAASEFSNRDRISNDIAAPGLRILSILPRPLTARFPACSEQGYSSCGPRVSRGAGDVVRRAAGERGAAVSAQPPTDPAAGAGHADPPADGRGPRAATGCAACGRVATRYSGWGRLDVAAAISALCKQLARTGLLRDERRPRHEGVHRVRIEPAHPGDARLLGRPG